jgi:Putative translation initiation inhibitor, yjgF family
VVKNTVYLTDMADFSLVNDVYASFFGEEKPARSCVGVSALPKGGLVESGVTAVKSEG